MCIMPNSFDRIHANICTAKAIGKVIKCLLQPGDARLRLRCTHNTGALAQSTFSRGQQTQARKYRTKLQSTNENQRQQKLCAQFGIAAVRWRGMEKTNLLCLGTRAGTRGVGRMAKEMTIQINSLNKMLTWLQSFIYPRKNSACTERTAISRNQKHFRSRHTCEDARCALEWHENETTIGPPAETVKQVAELRHNLLVWCMQCSLYSGSPSCVVIHFPRELRNCKHTTRAWCVWVTWVWMWCVFFGHRAVTTKAITHYLHINCEQQSREGTRVIVIITIMSSSESIDGARSCAAL